MTKTLAINPVVDEKLLFDYSFAELLFEEVKGTYKVFGESKAVKVLLEQLQLLRNIVTNLFFDGSARCAEVMKKYIKKVDELLNLETIHAWQYFLNPLLNPASCGV